MEEPDLEEGEACDYKDDATIDPDIALSYIGEKVQNVLGHFQKDFEGGVSKDNLGAKFGGYGSFLPTYQRSPPAKSQPKTPQMNHVYSTPKSPINFHVEGATQNHMAHSEVPIPLKTGTLSSNKKPLDIPKFACADVSAKMVSKPVYPPDQKTLKVRIKVGSDNTAKKNAAIYSGLGLISPSSSTENSHEDIDEPFNSQHLPDEYPSTILQDLLQECLLLSPLQERLLSLRRKKSIARESRLALSFKGRQNDSFRLEDGSASTPTNISKGKKTNSAGNFEAMEESKLGYGINFEDNLEHPLKKTTIPNAVECKKSFSLDTKLKPLHGLVNEMHDSCKDDVRGQMKDGILVKKREVNKKLATDKLLTTDLVKEEFSESISRNGGKCLQQEAKGSSMEKSRELGVRSSSKVVPTDPREGGNKVNRVPAPSKLHSDVSKTNKDTGSVFAAHIKQKVSSSKVTPEEQDRTKILPSKNVVSLGVKKKPKGIQNSDKSASVLVLKEKKSSQKNAHRVRESYDDVLDLRSEQQIGNQLSRPSGERTKDYKFEAHHGKEALDNVSRATEGVNGEMELGSAAPVVIEEDWVCCDRCQKWRLLPNGLKPEQLPENWLCSMLYWLPGMNHCDISEEETTKALHALYQLPLPETRNNFPTDGGRTAPGVPSADVMYFNQNQHNLSSDAMSNTGKKYKSKETPNAGSSSGGMHNASNFIKKPREDVMERRSLDEMKSKVQHLGQFGSLAVERHGDEPKEKRPSGGDLKQKKLKSKRAPDHSGYEAIKKIKTKAKDVTGKHEEDLQKHSGPKLGPKERLPVSVKQGDVNRSEGDLQSAKKRKLKDWQDSCNKQLESNGNHLPESKFSFKEEKSDSEARKAKKLRLSKNLEESTTKCRDDKTNNKGTLTRIILPGSRGESADKSMLMRDQPHRAKVLPKLTMEDVDSLRRDLGSEQFSMGAASSSSKVSDSRRSKRARLQDVKGSPVESVSSSPMRTSKLSPARRGDMVQDDFQNGGLPVVASARKSTEMFGNLEKNQSGASMKSETIGGVSLPDRHDMDARHKSGAKAESVKNNHFVNSDRVDTKHLETSSHKSGKPSSLQLSKEKDRSSGVNFQKLMVKASNPSGRHDLNPKKIQNEPQSKQQLAPRQANAKHQLADECSSLKSSNDEMAIDNVSRKRPAESRKESLTKTREHNDGEATRGDHNLQLQSTRDFGGESVTKRDQSQQVESRSGKSRFNPQHAVKEEIQASHIRQLISDNLKGSDGDMLEVLNKPAKVVDATPINSVGNPMSDRGVVGDLSGSSTLKKDATSRTAARTLKEAEELKACADNFKDSGFHFECNEANFQAALKFLHAASLMETFGETSKHAELSPIQVYSSAAKLCEMCSQEYEKRQEMAAAVLAYKCMEVAYMRIVYCKSSSTNRDRHDLQASLQMAPQGESPSSSASDIDNLNNQAAVDKTTLSRGISSHAGNHLIVARNRPNFVRLLDFTNDVNTAMEASRKASNAFAVATVTLEASQNKEGIACVKRVIDFSFQDVEEFIRLVRHASEAISPQGFSSNRD